MASSGVGSGGERYGIRNWRRTVASGGPIWGGAPEGGRVTRAIRGRPLGPDFVDIPWRRRRPLVGRCFPPGRGNGFRIFLPCRSSTLGRSVGGRESAGGRPGSFRVCRRGGFDRSSRRVRGSLVMEIAGQVGCLGVDCRRTETENQVEVAWLGHGRVHG